MFTVHSELPTPPNSQEHSSIHNGLSPRSGNMKHDVREGTYVGKRGKEFMDYMIQCGTFPSSAFLLYPGRGKYPGQNENTQATLKIPRPYQIFHFDTKTAHRW